MQRAMEEENSDGREMQANEFFGYLHLTKYPKKRRRRRKSGFRGRKMQSYGRREF